MRHSFEPIPFRSVYEDLVGRTLAKIPCDLSRLIYLASARDYNTGNYHHAGLAARYSVEATQRALERAHQEVFVRLASASLKELVEQLEMYIKGSRETADQVLEAWQRLEPYRVAIPLGVDPTSADFLLSNIRVALAILRFRLSREDSRP